MKTIEETLADAARDEAERVVESTSRDASARVLDVVSRLEDALGDARFASSEDFINSLLEQFEEREFLTDRQLAAAEELLNRGR